MKGLFLGRWERGLASAVKWSTAGKGVRMPRGGGRGSRCRGIVRCEGVDAGQTSFRGKLATGFPVDGRGTGGCGTVKHGKRRSEDVRAKDSGWDAT
jgi:hypothetical protein